MPETFSKRIDVDYDDGRDEDPADYPTLPKKLEKAASVVRRGLDQYRNPAVMWTGGKDSTLAFYVVIQVAEEYGYDLPPAVFIDHFQHFPDIHDFVDRWANEWGIDVIVARNDDVGNLASDPGDTIRVADLNEQNVREVREKLEFDGETFPFLLNTYVGNHLLKTVALNGVLERNGIDGIVSGVRWDEQEARSDETFFSPRHDVEMYPPHDRIHPILQFEEVDVWDATWEYLVPDSVDGFPSSGFVPQTAADLPGDITPRDIPVSPKYFEGFRSLGSEIGTERSDDRPAWEQDLESTTERSGRAQDKEDLMGKLRDLGYM